MPILGKEIYVNKSYLEQWMVEHHFDVAMLAAATGTKTHIFYYLFNHSAREIVHEPVFKAICTLPGFDWQKFARFPKQIDMEPEPLIDIKDEPAPTVQRPVEIQETQMITIPCEEYEARQREAEAITEAFATNIRRMIAFVQNERKKIGSAAATEEPDTKVL